MSARFSLFILIILAANSHAFDARGHIAVCELAWQQVSAGTRQWLADVVRQSPEKRFNQGCVWPDEVKDQSRFRATKVWHYINVPRSATTVTAADCPAEGCVTRALEEMKTRLLADDNDWQALFFLGHFMADIHQPMHVSYADDRGGNRAPVTYQKDETNLHHLWDGELIRTIKMDDLLQQITPASKSDGMVPSADAIASETLQITRRIYADYRKTKIIDDAYERRMRPLLLERLSLAGQRLAATLDQIHEQLTKQPVAD